MSDSARANKPQEKQESNVGLGDKHITKQGLTEAMTTHRLANSPTEMVRAGGKISNAIAIASGVNGRWQHCGSGEEYEPGLEDLLLASIYTEINSIIWT